MSPFSQSITAPETEAGVQAILRRHRLTPSWRHFASVRPSVLSINIWANDASVFRESSRWAQCSIHVSDSLLLEVKLLINSKPRGLFSPLWLSRKVQPKKLSVCGFGAGVPECPARWNIAGVRFSLFTYCSLNLFRISVS